MTTHQERGWRRRSDLEEGEKLTKAELRIEELEGELRIAKTGDEVGHKLLDISIADGAEKVSEIHELRARVQRLNPESDAPRDGTTIFVAFRGRWDGDGWRLSLGITAIPCAVAGWLPNPSGDVSE